MFELYSMPTAAAVCAETRCAGDGNPGIDTICAESTPTGGAEVFGTLRHRCRTVSWTLRHRFRNVREKKEAAAELHGFSWFSMKSLYSLTFTAYTE